ncbi:MAG: cell division protein ZapB [Desulfosarcinaceae bacterium]|nr:cell division protein ZapB [Desulfosarcinaceae bacterium]
MEKQIVIEKFDAIERKIEGLIDTNQQLTHENIRLREEIDGLRHQITVLQENEQRQEEVKTIIRSKIDTIMAKLDDFAGNETVVDAG